jgi:hypothetical protein
MGREAKQLASMPHPIADDEMLRLRVQRDTLAMSQH